MRGPDESSKDFRRRVLDPVSSTFCAAKWYNTTLWLGSGHTASCHHPLPHEIPKSLLKADPSALHNTPQKIAARHEMLEGKWPKECDYCSKMEMQNPDAISDRISQSDFYSQSEIDACTKSWAIQRALPRVLEISFDRVCQFACSYCNPGYSTTWLRDIQKDGPYNRLQTVGGKAYQQVGSWADGAEEQSEYSDAFWRWWPELSQTLIELRVTGGEPLLSPQFKKFLEHFKRAPPHRELLLGINSNLGHSSLFLDKVLLPLSEFTRLGVYASCDCHGPLAEYVRDGLNYTQFVENLKHLLESKNLHRLQIMITVSNLTLFSLCEFLDELVGLKATFGKLLPSFSFNHVRFPSFFSPELLPKALKLQVAEGLTQWLAKNSASGLLWHAEVDGLERLITTLNSEQRIHTGESDETKEALDLKNFMLEYDRRRGKDFRKVLPEAFVSWIDRLGESNEQSDVRSDLYLCNPTSLHAERIR